MPLRGLWWWGVLWLLANGCIVDDEHPCGANQKELKDLFEGCVCVAGAVPNADGVGCRLCGENEEAQGSACVCTEGFARMGTQAPCTPVEDAGSEADAGMSSTPSGQDQSCASQADCAGFAASYCETLQAKVCWVPGCATGENVCGSDRECCDLSAVPVPSLVATNGLCVAKGGCVAPGKVVTP